MRRGGSAGEEGGGGVQLIRFLADVPSVFATFQQKLLFRRGETLISTVQSIKIAISSRRNAHFHFSTCSTGLSCLNATFKDEQTAWTIRQFWQLALLLQRGASSSTPCTCLFSASSSLFFLLPCLFKNAENARTIRQKSSQPSG